MSAQGALAGLWLCVIPAAVAAPDAARSYDGSRRVAYLDAALDAVRGATPEQLSQSYEYASAMDRGKCASSALRLKVECLMTAARNFCKPKDARCPLLMDVIASNVLAEGHFVSTDRRYEIMKAHRDWREEVGRELRRIQGGLAVDFRLHQEAQPSAATLGKRIDSYCVATADKSNLSWQTCASSLVWFIATGKEATPR